MSVYVSEVNISSHHNLIITRSQLGAAQYNHTPQQCSSSLKALLKAPLWQFLAECKKILVHYVHGHDCCKYSIKILLLQYIKYVRKTFRLLRAAQFSLSYHRISDSCLFQKLIVWIFIDLLGRCPSSFMNFSFMWL